MHKHKEEIITLGEKIRDVYPVRIGDTKLMVELNENYALIPTGGGGSSLVRFICKTTDSDLL